MNRTDQAPEPTMEEILASIRLIISDDVKKPAEEQLRPAPPRPEPVSLSALPEEDVLELTDAHVFPEEAPAASAPPSSMGSRPAKPTAPLPEVSAEDSAPAETATPPETLQTAETPPQPELYDAPVEHRQDLPFQAQTGSRPIWSRRELPGSPPPVAAPMPRYEGAAPSRQPQRNWTQDVQMPIPERGPVSLIPGQTQPQDQEEKDERDTRKQGEPESEAGGANSLGEKEEAAVAALVENLARSAAGAMNSDELATAGDVDFSRLDHEQKAEVTETFAKAIQRDAGSRDKHPLPTLLDEVFRQDFRRGSPADEEPEEESAEPEAAASAKEDEKKANDRPAPHWGVPGMASPAITNREPMPWTRSDPPSRTAETFAQTSEALAQKTATVTASPREDEPVLLARSGPTLEDTVRDMLRPLMMQWLDEHMPRILENAIREEIATRGLLPKTEK